MTGPPPPEDARLDPVADLELEVPARPEFVRTARHTVAALARMLELGDHAVDDVRLAVSEAVTTAVVGAGPSGRSVGLTVRLKERERMVIEVDGPGPGPAASGQTEVGSDLNAASPPSESELAVPIVRGLADDLAILPIDGGGTRMRMTLSLGG